jgi:hypothetical protein
MSDVICCSSWILGCFVCYVGYRYGRQLRFAVAVRGVGFEISRFVKMYFWDLRISLYHGQIQSHSDNIHEWCHVINKRLCRFGVSYSVR